MSPRFALVLALLGFSIVTAFPQTFAATQGAGLPSGVIAVGPAVKHQLRAFTIIVSSDGFNGSSSPPAIQVSQGDNLTITFVYGDTKLKFDNPHQIKIEGYSVQTPLLSKASPKQRISIIVGTTGKFQFHCIAPCFGMDNLQGGTIDVSPSAKPAQPIGTSFGAISLQAGHGTSFVSTRLIDANGTAVPGVIVNFFAKTDFGEMSIGQNTTGQDGGVQLSYLPTQEVTEVRASFSGDQTYLSSSSVSSVTNVGQVQSLSVPTPYVAGQSQSVDMRLVAIPPLQGYGTILVVLMIIGGIWSVYTFVLTNLLGIPKAAKSGGKKN